jgi:hypothetical protein
MSRRQPNDQTGDAVAQLMDTLDRLARGGSGPARDRDNREVAGPELLLALANLRRLRDSIAVWEPVLIAAARDRGVTWNDLAPALGVASRQAAERRYLRLNPRTADHPRTTREQRVDATRGDRAGERAVADWAQRNAAELRQLAGQVTLLDGLDRAAQDRVDRLHGALGAADAANLIAPLAEAGAALSDTHPALAEQITAVNRTTDEVRAEGRRRRTSTMTLAVHRAR